MQNPYLALPRVRAALRSLGVRPTRGMGQNFLIDADALAAIVGAADLNAGDTVIEVGPGLGVLTWELLQRAGQVASVELDRRLAARLRDEFPQAQWHLIESDILRITAGEILSHLPTNSQYKVVANLPYAITAPVLRHFLEAVPPPSVMVVLVQWEVAERVCATPGDLSVLAHAVQFYATPEIIARVPGSSFEPPPAVDSAVLRLRQRTEPPVAVDDVDRLFRVIKAGFAQPRKKVANSLAGGLASLGHKIPRERSDAALAAAAIAPERRAETVTLVEWAAVYTALRDLL